MKNSNLSNTQQQAIEFLEGSEGKLSVSCTGSFYHRGRTINIKTFRSLEKKGLVIVKEYAGPINQYGNSNWTEYRVGLI